MNLLESWKNIIEKAKSLSEKDLESLRYLMFVLVVADLVGVFWYLGLKKLGIAILICLILFLTIILLLERNLPIKKNQKEVKMPEETKEQEIEETDLDIGLPSAEEYSKNLREAIEG